MIIPMTVQVGKGLFCTIDAETFLNHCSSVQLSLSSSHKPNKFFKEKGIWLLLFSLIQYLPIQLTPKRAVGSLQRVNKVLISTGRVQSKDSGYKESSRKGNNVGYDRDGEGERNYRTPKSASLRWWYSQMTSWKPMFNSPTSTSVVNHFPLLSFNRNSHNKAWPRVCWQ